MRAETLTLDQFREEVKPGKRWTYLDTTIYEFSNVDNDVVKYRRLMPNGLYGATEFVDTIGILFNVRAGMEFI